MFMKAPILFSPFGIFVFLSLTNPVAGNPDSEEEQTGKLAKFGQFPYVTRLYSRHKDYAVNYCTATIITHSKLLTAGHCCHSKAFRFVVLGDPDQTDFVYGYIRKKYVMYVVDKVIIHPKYEKTEDKLVYDLCLLILNAPMRSSDGHEAIKISYDRIKNIKNCTALGWGSTIGYEIQHKLYYKEALGYGCNLRFGNSSKYWFVCLEPHSVCPGDSGGPLVCDGKLYGIASFFIGQGDENDPKCEGGVVDYYAALFSEKDFIEKNSCITTLPSILSLLLLCHNLISFSIYL